MCLASSFDSTIWRGEHKDHACSALTHVRIVTNPGDSQNMTTCWGIRCCLCACSCGDERLVRQIDYKVTKLGPKLPRNFHEKFLTWFFLYEIVHKIFHRSHRGLFQIWNLVRRGGGPGLGVSQGAAQGGTAILMLCGHWAGSVCNHTLLVCA